MLAIITFWFIGGSQDMLRRGGLVVVPRPPEREVGVRSHSGRRVVSLSKKHLPPKKVLAIPRKRWFRPDMTEKLLTGT